MAKNGWKNYRWLQFKEPIEPKYYMRLHRSNNLKKTILEIEKELGKEILDRDTMRKRMSGIRTLLLSLAFCFIYFTYLNMVFM